MKAIADPARIDADPPGDPPAAAFRNRQDAGIRLSELLGAYKSEHPLVLGLARGGVPVAAAIARALDGELDVLVVRKLGSPMSEELAIGAVTAGGGRVVNDRMIRELGISGAYIERETKAQMAEAARRETRYRGTGGPPAVAGRTVIVVDDGLATGATMLAAVRWVRARMPKRLVVAVPVGSRDACAMLQAEADAVVCLATPDPFWAVGVCYIDFGQVQDEEVERLLREARPAPTR
jgi:putative phosphoribosyl transferase